MGKSKGIIAEEVAIVDSIVFIAPDTSGGYLVYAFIGKSWKPYDFAETRAEALRKARKSAFRLKNAGVIHDAKSSAVER